MPVISNKPADLTPKNDLDNIPDDLLGPVPARIEMSGKTLLVMEEPPQPGEFFKLEVTLRCKDEGRELLADGDYEHYRKTAFISAELTVPPFKPEPEPAPEPEPGLFDESGDIPADEGDEDGAGAEGYGPGFSHGGADD